MNLLLTGCFQYKESQIEKLKDLGYQIYYMQQEAEALPLSPANVDATVCNGLFLTHNIEKFTNLKLIQLTSAGLDRVPIDKIKERDILLHNARGVYSIPMAEWVLFRVLEHYKQGTFFHTEQESRHWAKRRDLREIVGCNVAIIGAGNVGQEVAKRFQAMDATTIGFDVHTNVTPGFDEMRLIDTLLDAVTEMDVIVVTAPLLPATQGLISRQVLERMKHGAVLVNIARGGLVNQQALVDVFTQRKDLYAALDVFESEPLKQSDSIWNLPNVALSPHNSFVSNGNNERMFNVIYSNLKSYISSVR